MRQWNTATDRTRFIICRLVAVALMCLLGATAAFAQIEWQGASGGNWDVSGNWVGNVVPNGNVSAENLTANTILLDSGTFAINGFNSTNASANFELFGGELDANSPGASTFSMTGQLIMQGSGTLSGFVVNAAGGVSNNGTAVLNGINFAGGTNFTGNFGTNTVVTGLTTNTGNMQINGGSGSNTELTLAGATTFAGAGTVTLEYTGGNGSAFIQGNGQTLTNNSTIQGTGVIGNGSLAIINNGTINANNNGATPTLTLNGSGLITNTGLMEATNGGLLNLNGITVNNAGGNITASTAADSVFLNGSTQINGGTFNNTAGGTLGTTTGQTAFLNGSVNSVTINGGYTGELGSNTVIQGNFQNNGNIQIVGGSGNNTELSLSGNATINGGGTVTLQYLGGNGTAFIQGNNQTLTNNSTIQGAGVIGNGNIAINNTSLINANSAGQTLALNTSGLVTNTSTLEASNGGVLQLAGVTINNNGGAIKALAGGDTVQLFGNTTVQGGALTNTGGGTIAGTGNVFLDGSTPSGAVTLNGNYTVSPSTATYMLGTINNTGNITVMGGNGSNTAFATDSTNVTLQGGGTVTLSTLTGNGSAILEQGAGGQTLTNVNNTIQGDGVIGNNGLTLINESGGIINANSLGTTEKTILAIQGLGGTMVNAGLLEASNAGVLQLNGDTITNAGGIITANTGADVQISGNTTISGGTLNNLGGTLEGTGTVVLDGSTLGALTINGKYSVDPSTTTYLAGTINNNNIIQINGGGGFNTVLATDSPTLILQGGGTVQLTSLNGNGLAFLEQGAGGQTLVNVNNTIQGEGIIGNNSLTLTNTAGGVINANSNGNGVSTTLALQALGGPTTNQGLMEATNNGELLLNGGTINNAGGLITAVGSGASVVLEGNITIQGGTVTNNGGLVTTAGTVTLDGSTVSGPINLNGTFNVGAGTVTALAGTVNNNGIINVNGGGGSNTILETDSANVILQGGGTVSLNTAPGNGLAFLQQGAGGQTLTNVNNTIQGEGVIGENSLTLVNTAGGTVNANYSSGGGINTLTFQAASVTNQGLMEATNNGALMINGVTVNNTGGLITAVGPGASVQLFGSTTIQGGTLTNNGGFLGSTGTVILDGNTTGPITLNGTYTGGLGTTTYLEGTINNQGTMQINGGAGSNTDLDIATQNVQLTGGGTINLNYEGGNGAISVVQNAGGTTLENINNTIQGVGTIGVNGLSLLNDVGGTVVANVNGGTLAINEAGNVTNNGTFEADAGATLHVQSVGAFTNFSGNTLSGGTYISNGTLTATGTLQIDALGNTGGEIVNNAATIVLNGPNSNFVDAAGLDALSNLAANTTATSDLTITGGRVLTVASNSNSFTNAGSVFIGTGSQLNIGGTGTGSFTQTGGLTTINGTLDPLSVDIKGGILAGTGSISGNVLAEGGTIAPGSPGATGTLTINGSLNDTGSTLNIRLGGTGAGAFDVLDVNGPVTLGAGSVLDVSLFNGFNPTNGETFTFLDFSPGSLTSLGLPNFFGTDNGLTTPGGVFNVTETNNDGLTLTFAANQNPPPPPPPNGTPEPAPMVMLGAGAVAWAMLRRRVRGMKTHG